MKQAHAGQWLIARALWELCRYDLAIRVFGFRRVARGFGKARLRTVRYDPEIETRVCAAMNWALSLYWKRVLCLQRSLATARLLRSCSLDARVVIGCRPEPFVSHAWVEIDGRVVNDSPGYQKLLCVLERI
jgi:hypothetical protein